MNKVKIIIASTMIALITAFAIFQYEKEIAVAQRGECAVKALVLFSKSFENNQIILPGSIQPLFKSTADFEETVEFAILSQNSESTFISSGWSPGDNSFVVKLIAKAEARGVPITGCSGGTDPQYMFSVYPIKKSREDVVFVVLREQVGEVRRYFRNTLKRMTLTATATGIGTAGVFLVIAGVLKRNKE